MIDFNTDDYWLTDEFFALTEEAMLAQLEKNITYQGHKRIPKGRLYNTLDLIGFFRNSYTYIPSKDRVVLDHDDGCKNQLHVIARERIPDSSSIYLDCSRITGEEYSARGIVFMKCRGQPKGIKVNKSDIVYEVMQFTNYGNSLDTSKWFVALDGKLNVKSAPFVSEAYGGFGRPNHKIDSSIHDKEHLDNFTILAFYAMQIAIDKQSCWTIQALEDGCKVELGVNAEQIKSLMYARDTPLTESGRLSPILHLVKSHKRRIKNGVDIKMVDVQSYLRGQQTVKIGNTLFTVQPPRAISNEITENSLKYLK